MTPGTPAFQSTPIPPSSSVRPKRESYDEDRREATKKLARLEELDREVEEEARKEEKRKKEAKRRAQEEMEGQRDSPVRIDDDESRGNSTHSRRDSSWKAWSEERRPPGCSPSSVDKNFSYLTLEER